MIQVSTLGAGQAQACVYGLESCLHHVMADEGLAHQNMKGNVWGRRRPAYTDLPWPTRAWRTRTTYGAGAGLRIRTCHGRRGLGAPEHEGYGVGGDGAVPRRYAAVNSLRCCGARGANCLYVLWQIHEVAYVVTQQCCQQRCRQTSGLLMGSSGSHHNRNRITMTAGMRNARVCCWKSVDSFQWHS